jgi:hypothetical protein
MRRSLTLTFASTAACTLLLTGCSADARSGASAASTTGAHPGAGSSTTAASRSPAAPSTPALTLTAWYSGGGRVIITALNSGVAAVATDEVNHDDAQLLTDCLKLSEVLTPASFYPPIPDAQAERDWASALAGLHRGYATCDSGPSTSANQGAVLVEEAAPDLGLAVERITSLPH